MKKMLILLAVLLCLAPAMAEEPAHYVEGNYRYYLTDEGAVLTNYLPASCLRRSPVTRSSATSSCSAISHRRRRSSYRAA